MKEKVNSAVLLARILTTRTYKSSFGRGFSQTAGAEEFYYNPDQECFVLREIGEVLIGSWWSKHFPCSPAQAKAILRAYQLLTEAENRLLFAYQGKLCLVEKHERGASFGFYTRRRAHHISLSLPLATSLMTGMRHHGIPNLTAGTA